MHPVDDTRDALWYSAIADHTVPCDFVEIVGSTNLQTKGIREVRIIHTRI